MSENIYETTGKPSVPYGIIRHVAFQERNLMDEPYLRVLYGEGGRRGDPWGGLSLEVNGHIFHFCAGMKRYPHLHDGKGGLLPEGNMKLANGLPGYLEMDETDWRWIQEEVDLTPLLSADQILLIAEHYEELIQCLRRPAKISIKNLGKTVREANSSRKP